MHSNLQGTFSKSRIQDNTSEKILDIITSFLLHLLKFSFQPLNDSLISGRIAFDDLKNTSTNHFRTFLCSAETTQTTLTVFGLGNAQKSDKRRCTYPTHRKHDRKGNKEGDVRCKPVEVLTGNLEAGFHSCEEIRQGPEPLKGFMNRLLGLSINRPRKFDKKIIQSSTVLRGGSASYDQRG